MKQFFPRSLPCMTCVIAAAFILFINHAHADRIFSDSFESPNNPPGGTDPDGWSAPGHPGYFGVANEGDGSNWSTPYGEQGIGTYSSGVATKTLDFIDEVEGVYTFSFNISSSASMGEYRVELWTKHPWLGDTLVGFTEGDTDGSKDMSFSDSIVWRPGALDAGAALEVRLGQDPNRGNWRNTPIFDNVALDFIPDNDISPPTVTDISDDRVGGSVAPNSPIIYTVTFSEDIDATTVSTADFGNQASAPVTIDSVAETAPSSGVFTVQVTPTGAGTLRLTINPSAVIKDVEDNILDTFFVLDVTDDTTIFVEGTLPLLNPSDIVDDKGGSPVAPNTLVTYTVTFNKDMDDTTVTADDFVNAGTASVTIGTVTETATPGEFTVEATPTDGGTLQLSVKAFEVLKDAAGNELNTDSAIADNTTIAVDAIAPTLDEIVDDQGGSSVVANTLVTYSVNFPEDMDESTVIAADFGNAGTASFSIIDVSEATPGVFSVEVMPTGIGTLQLRINASAVLKDFVGNALDTTLAILDDTTITVTAPPSNPYDTWASGALFDDDANGDEVDNGLAWLLGASGTTADARLLLPVTSRNGGNLRLTFRCLKTANRGDAKLKVQFSNDLGQTDSWVSHEAEVPDIDSTVNGVIFDTTEDGNYIDVIADIPAGGGQIFARIVGVGP